MALETLTAPIRSTPPAPALRSVGSGQTENRDDQRPESTASEESVGATALQAGNAAIAEVLRGSIVNLVV